MKIELFSEPFHAYGGLEGGAAEKTLGVSVMSKWELLLRETLQNSWDARSSSNIRYGVDVSLLGDEEIQNAIESIFWNVPPSLDEFINTISDGARPKLITIWDSGTKGLGGSVRADEARLNNQRSDFVDFIFNIGRPSAKQIGGGTYGFGKGILYRISSIKTCFIYSQTEVNGKIESRFIATHVGSSYNSEGRQWTGRHWWGEVVSAEQVLPLIGKEASDIAKKLGLGKLTETETGTVIGIIEPSFDEDESLEDVLTQINSAARKWAWPHMVSNATKNPSIDFIFQLQGIAQNYIQIDKDPEYSDFINSYLEAVELSADQKIQRSGFIDTRRIHISAFPKDMGVLSFTKRPKRNNEKITSLTGKVALMRKPLFIVEYLEVAEALSDEVLAGVFVSSDLADATFADKEPPAHDQWVVEPNEGTQPKPVRLVIRDIKRVFKPATFEQNIVTESDRTGVERLSRTLGAALSGAWGTGAELRAKNDRIGGSKKPSVSISVLQNPRLNFNGSHLLTDFFVKLTVPSSIEKNSITLTCDPRIVLESGQVEATSSKEKPITGDFAEVIGWGSSSGEFLKTKAIPISNLKSTTGLFVRIKQPLGIAVSVDIKWVSNESN